MDIHRLIAVGAPAVLFLIAVAALPVNAGNGVVAVQTADPSCTDSSGKVYVDCGNGTVTDNRTGLVWLKNADCLGDVDFQTAMEFAAGLSDMPSTSAAAAHDCGLSDGSSPGEWRLPSAAEWEAMIADAVALGCISGQSGGPSITDDTGSSCWQEGPGNSFTGIQNDEYWSSTTSVIFPDVDAWRARLEPGNLSSTGVKIGDLFVWPVRGGQ